jgi:hypothetical protein
MTTCLPGATASFQKLLVALAEVMRIFYAHRFGMTVSFIVFVYVSAIRKWNTCMLRQKKAQPEYVHFPHDLTTFIYV